MSKLIPKHQTPSQPLVLSQDNTRVENPYIASIPITETNLYKQYLADPYKNSDFNTWKQRQELIQSNRKDEKVKADKRSSKVKEQETKQGKAIHNQQQRKELESKVNKGIWTGIGLGGLALAQATPAAPYVDAAFATLGATGLAKQYEEGTLGLNLETGLNLLTFTPYGIKAFPYISKAGTYIREHSPIFIPAKNSFTRGIGRGTEGITDLVNTGVVRGNPRGTEVTAHHFAKLWRKNRLHFKDIMKDTGIPNIEQKFFSRTLTKKEFDAIKKAASKYKVDDFLSSYPISLKPITTDPLSEYNSFDDYIKAVQEQVSEVESMTGKIKSGEVKVNTKLKEGKNGLSTGIPIEERFGANSDYVGDGHPLTYWYSDGRNPFRKGYDYAGSDWGVRVLNADTQTPFMHDLHPSFFYTPRLDSPNVQIFRRLPFGLGLRVPKTWVRNKFKIQGNKPITTEPAYLKDPFGKEIVPTPYPGTDAQLQGVVQSTWRQVLLDYFKNPKKVEQIKQTMGWGDAEIAKLQDEMLRAIGSNIGVKISGVDDGFNMVGAAKGNVLGQGPDAKGFYQITLNRDRIPDNQIAIEGAMHEIGGHAKTLSIAPEQFGNPKRADKMVSEWFPYLTKFIEKNKQLGDEILELNEKGKFLSQFKKSQDAELYAEANKSWDSFSQLLNEIKRFKYVTSSQEKYARGYTGQLYEKLYGPSTKTLNIKQLEEYYTPESVERFKKALLGITPIAIGVGATNK